MCGFAGQKNPSSGVSAAFAICNGPVLLADQQRSVPNLQKKILPVKIALLPFLTLSSVKSAAISCHQIFLSGNTPVNKTVQSVFSSNSRMISLYCSLFRFGAEAPYPGMYNDIIFGVEYCLRKSFHHGSGSPLLKLVYCGCRYFVWQQVTPAAKNCIQIHVFGNLCDVQKSAPLRRKEYHR